MLLDRPFRPTVAKLSVSTLVAWGALYYAFSVLLPAMQADLGWSTATLAAGLSIGLLTSGAVSPFVGARIDRLGPRSTMAAGALVGVAGLFVWSVASSVPVYLFAWVLVGAGMAATLYEPAFATLVRNDPRTSRIGILIVSVVGALAATVFLPLSAFLIDALGWRRTLWALAVGLAATSLPLNLALPLDATRVAIGVLSEQDVPRANAPDEEGRSLRGITAAVMLANTAGVAFSTYVVVLLIGAGETAQSAGFIAGSAGFAKIAGRFASSVATRWRSLSLLRASLLVQALSVLPVVLWPSSAATLTAVIVFGACSGARTVLRPAAVLEVAGPGQFGRKNGVVHLFSMLAKSAAPVGFGFVVALGSPSLAWSVLGGLMLTAALVVPRPQRRVGARTSGEG